MLTLSAAGAGCKKHKPPPMALIALGPANACAQIERGAAVCWGENAHGQLGDGTTETRTLPLSSRSAGPEPFTVLAVGARHACGVHADGAVACWGDGARGQVGNGTFGQQTTPTLTPVRGARLLVAGAEHSCAVTDGEAFCWGRNASGQLDDGTAADRATPVSPAVTRGRRAALVALGDAHTCFAFEAPEREVRCVGRDDHGQSGAGAPLLRGVELTSLGAGRDHTCAATAAGAVHCWGAGAAGQLGDGGFAGTRVPVLVAGLANVAQVRAGSTHTCARLRSNTVSCWGANDHHQLADGTVDPSPRAKPIFGLVGAQDLSAAGDATCVRLTGGFVRCWGDNRAGQLGDGTLVEHDVPMPVKWR